MQVEKYHLKSDSTFTRFEFVSEGTKGVIRKFIEFQETNYTGLFNLAFGDKNSSSESIDDLSVSNNGDTEKVLATLFQRCMPFATSTQMLLYMLPAAQKHEQDFIEWELQNIIRRYKSISTFTAS